jgi:hypothetical protein
MGRNAESEKKRAYRIGWTSKPKTKPLWNPGRFIADTSVRFHPVRTSPSMVFSHAAHRIDAAIFLWAAHDVIVIMCAARPPLRKLF